MGLALVKSSADVFRALVLAIVWTLAVGQNASVLCAVWCHPETGPTAACEHQEPSTSLRVTANDNCPEVTGRVTAFVREDLRRKGSARHALPAVVVPPFQLALPLQSAFGSDSRRRPPLETRPLVLALRI